MLLQNTINELNSGIINIENNKIKLTGFLSEERLNDYLDGDDCRCLIGVFPTEEYDIAYIKDNALFLIIKDNIEIGRYKFVPLNKDTISYKDNNNILRSKTFTIRKCSYTNQYNYIDSEISLLFNTKLELINYIHNSFNYKYNI